MKWALIAIGLLAAAVLAVAVLAFLIPVKHSASRTTDFQVPPEKVWQKITTVSSLPSWRKDLQEVEVLPDHDGHTVWRETDANGDSITFEMLEADPPRKLVTKIADTDLGFGGSWTYEIVPTPSGSQLTITENGEVYNPLFRLVSHFVMGHHATIDTYMDNLRQAIHSSR